MKTSSYMVIAISGLVLGFCSVGGGQGLPLGQPSELGFSPERLGQIDRHFEEQVEQGVLPGVVALVARRGEVAYFKSFGMADIEREKPMPKDAIMRLVSMTKPIVSAAVMVLYEEGHFLLSDPVERFVPEFADAQVLVEVNLEDTTYVTEPAKGPVTIAHLLTHTSGLSYGFADETFRAIYLKAEVPDAFVRWNTTIGAKMRLLASLPLAHHPGEKFLYSLSTDMLGYLVEVVSGMPLDQFLKERVFAPLKMEDTYFYLPLEKRDRLAAVHGQEGGRLVRYDTADYPIEGAMTYFSGGAGLSSTAADYARFCQMMLNGGSLDGVRLLSPKTVELMTTDHVEGEEVQFGLGFNLRDGLGKSGDLLGSKGTYEWGGYFHTSFWVDPQEQLIGILMAQVQPTSYNAERFRPLVYQALDN